MRIQKVNSCVKILLLIKDPKYMQVNVATGNLYQAGQISKTKNNKI